MVEPGTDFAGYLAVQISSFIDTVPDTENPAIHSFGIGKTSTFSLPGSGSVSVHADPDPGGEKVLVFTCQKSGYSVSSFQ